MRIERIILNNFRIYKDKNEVTFNDIEGKNISLIAGKNGFGKTTFLSSLIWCFYGALMSQVEEKYKKDIKNAGGYEKFLQKLINNHTLNDFLSEKTESANLSAEVHLVDVLIPSIPCKKVVIRRSYDYETNEESLKILIDGQENQLTKEVGYEVFINDFILPREIAKFFFFDAEKIVTLAEAKSKNELRSLSKAYSEVLGIKKYEDLKLNLKSLLTKLKRGGVSTVEKSKLDELIRKETEYNELIELNEKDQNEKDVEISNLKLRIDSIQEQLIREGNEITLEELKEFKAERDSLKKEHNEVKLELKKMLEIVPLVIAGKKLKDLVDQITAESNLKNKNLNNNVLKEEINKFSSDIIHELDRLKIEGTISSKINKAIYKLMDNRFDNKKQDYTNIILDLNDEKSREIIATYNYITDSFRKHFNIIIKKERDTRQHLTRVLKKIKLAEARKGNPLAQKLRENKEELVNKMDKLGAEKEKLIAERAVLKNEQASNNKVLSEYEKNFNLVSTDKKKYEVTLQLLEKLNILTAKIKEQKKYSLQKSIVLGLRKLMHKDDFVSNVNVRIEDDVMDIDLLDKNNHIIDKDSLSKGEQQLYATALLKALVDESGINFPVFIDSPLQKFDKEHSSNVIQQFYPTISEQVVLFPLLEKELSLNEYNQLKKHLSGVHLIENNSIGSSIEKCKIDELFTKFNEQNYVFTN
jgi:DNA sulfur modification protein DndD